jgi:hypothetical protein
MAICLLLSIASWQRCAFIWGGEIHLRKAFGFALGVGQRCQVDSYMLNVKGYIPSILCANRNMVFFHLFLNE